MHSIAQQWIDGVLLASPVAKALGLTLAAAQVDEVTLALSYDDDLTTVPGVIHGGVVSALVDTAGAAASASGLGPDNEASGGATTHLAVSYLAPAQADLTATATVVHRTRSTTLSEVRVRDAHGTLVATGQVHSRLFR
ncbi:PaaI family thioesterase [Nocardioides sp. WS12]|uniref:PaaI family thioesterase n=1 Tax=Nocardioides sp. WS12 TaxID=2486272 RepID=UPI0015FB1DB3|nr:PaaI family thioesterase [Nocardioides sp. WS12]